MYLVASVCLSVRTPLRQSVSQRATTAIISHRFVCVSNQWAYADNRADAVDRLLILNCVRDSQGRMPGQG